MKKIVYSILGICLFSVVVFFGLDMVQYREYINAEGQGCPLQDGGTVMGVQMCTVTYPSGVCLDCTAINPKLVANVQCGAYKQVIVMQNQNTTINAFAVPKTFNNIKGGGTDIVSGDQYLYCGTTAALPIVWGAPGKGAKRIQYLVDAFDNFKVFIASI